MESVRRAVQEAGAASSSQGGGPDHLQQLQHPAVSDACRQVRLEGRYAVFRTAITTSTTASASLWRG